MGRVENSEISVILAWYLDVVVYRIFLFFLHLDKFQFLLHQVGVWQKDVSQ